MTTVLFEHKPCLAVLCGRLKSLWVADSPEDQEAFLKNGTLRGVITRMHLEAAKPPVRVNLFLYAQV